jgi:hypothetical protein
MGGGLGGCTVDLPFATFVVFAHILRVKGSRAGSKGGEDWFITAMRDARFLEASREPPS